MSEQVNPGVDPPRRGSLSDPARKLGGQDQAVQAMARRLQALERFLQPYREKLVQVRRDDGTFQTISVLAKEGGGAAGGGYGSTIVPKSIYQKDGVWRLIFHPAMFVENSLAQAGKAHEIKAGKGNLTDDPPPEFALSGKTEQVWLKFGVTRESSIAADSPGLVIGGEPEKKVLEPKRPNFDGKDGEHSQLVGTVKFTDGAPEWIPANSDATASIYLPAIQCIGDGERDYDSYLAKPPTDKYRTFRGQNDAELEEAGYTEKLEEEFGESEYSGFEIRELPVKVSIDLTANTLVFKGFCKVPVPKGMSGSYSWMNCGDDDGTGPKASVNRGIIVVNESQAGDFEACGCDSCGDTSTFTPGP
jgi:hypothetical protein